MNKGVWTNHKHQSKTIRLGERHNSHTQIQCDYDLQPTYMGVVHKRYASKHLVWSEHQIQTF